METKITLSVQDKDTEEVIFNGEYLSISSLEEDLHKAESAIETAEKKRIEFEKGLEDEAREDEIKERV